MYTPKHFAEHDASNILRFVEANGFATLVSLSGGGFVASHLPLLVEGTAEEFSLIGHMAKANPQWRELKDEKTLVIFQGAHAYISPSWYTTNNAVPTWNYLAVHVYGTFKPVNNPETVESTLRRMVDTYESRLNPAWTLDEVDASTVRSLMNAIVAFRIDVDRVEAKSKLNQNHSRESREKVIESLTRLGGDNRNAIADAMRTIEPISDNRQS